MSLSALDQAQRHVLMFGGKGGVGKTTASATTALHFAARGKQTLIISSDLTPSLSDIFETQIGAVETPIPAVPNLWGLEIDPDEVMRRWKVKFGPEIYDAAQSMVDMPYDDLVDYVGMAPGIQEEFMLDFHPGADQGRPVRPGDLGHRPGRRHSPPAGAAATSSWSTCASRPRCTWACATSSS